MSSWLDPDEEGNFNVTWGDIGNFLLSFPLFTPFQIHSWAVQATLDQDEGWFPSTATAEEQLMYGLYWLDLAIIGTVITGESVSVVTALSVPARGALALVPAVAPAAAVLTVAAAGLYVGHKVYTAEPEDPWYDTLQDLGRNISMSAS